MSICKKCKRQQTFGETGNRGLGFKISVKCLCGTYLIDSGSFIRNAYEINRRIMFVMRLLGVAREGINLFCGFMDLGAGLSSRAYDSIIKYVYDSAKKMFDISCQQAAEEEKEENEKKERPLLDFTVSGDGSWKKKGFSSLYGVTTLIAYRSGKVIDLIVKESYCQTCTYYKNDKNNPVYLDHEEQCVINHTGLAGKMEVDAVSNIFALSKFIWSPLQ